MIYKSYRVLIVVIVCLIFSACTKVKEIRDRHTDSSYILDDPRTTLSATCGNRGEFQLTAKGTPVPGDVARHESIEHFSNSAIGYVEFDDQGWLHPVTPPNKVNQIDAILNLIKKDRALSSNRDREIVILVFVHGWHHSAAYDDCNVNEFRVMVTQTAAQLSHEKSPPLVYGIYVGWRGESVNLWGLRYLTFVDRRDTAEHVAKGSVRQLFAQLREFSEGLGLLADAPRGAAPATGEFHHKMHTLVVGHSFGGLIAFQALSQALTNDVVALKPTQNSDGVCLTPDLNDYSSNYAASFGTDSGTASQPNTRRVAHSIWPSQLILINPAFEASRYEALYRAASFSAEESASCGYGKSARSPRVLTVAAENDKWTGWVFHTVRWMATRFEAYDSEVDEQERNEKDANLHSIGFTKRYLTHVLGSPSDSVIKVSCFSSNAAANISDTQLRASDKQLRKACRREGNSDLQVGTEGEPLWVALADKKIVNGHDQFLSDSTGNITPLMNWIICLDRDALTEHRHDIDESELESCQCELKIAQSAVLNTQQKSVRAAECHQGGHQM